MQFLHDAEKTRKTRHGKLTPETSLAQRLFSMSLRTAFSRRTSKKNGRLPERENRPGVKLFSTPVLPGDVMRRIFLYIQVA